jgi:hypothetical protein
MPFMGFARGALRFTGEVRGHVSKAANGGQARRNFCPSCGSLVFGGEPESSQALNIYAGSLDDSTSFQPSIAIFASSRPHWALIPPGLTTFERMPEDSR